MKQTQLEIVVLTKGQGLFDITSQILDWTEKQHIQNGLLTLFIRHTSASLTIQENADPDVLDDLNMFFRRLVKEDSGLYRHTAEGADDMPAHIRSALTNVALSIPVYAGKPVLGTWQGIYIFEHRSQPHNRNLHMHLCG